MKKITALLLVLAFILSFTGCGCKHTWVEATCTAPRTCQQCQATEGAALGHTWNAASCAAPKTCAVCAATEGEALPHTWVDATYDAPKTCSECAATEGDPLVRLDLGCEVEELLGYINYALMMGMGGSSAREESRTEDGLAVYRVCDSSGARYHISFVITPAENSSMAQSIQFRCESGGGYDFDLMLALGSLAASYVSENQDENLMELSGYGKPVGTTEEGYLIYEAINDSIVYTLVQESEDSGTLNIARDV